MHTSKNEEEPKAIAVEGGVLEIGRGAHCSGWELAG